MDLINSELICGQESPNIFGLDFSTAPSLLFYSYIPIIILSFTIASFILINNRKSLQSKSLFVFTTFFIIWTINILLQWISSYHTVILLAWRLTALIEIGVYISAIYFSYVFIFRKDIGSIYKIIISSVILITLILTMTRFNIASYNIKNCEGVLGNLWKIIYLFEPSLIVVNIYLGFIRYKEIDDEISRRQLLIFAIGINTFLSIFFLSNFYGELTHIYEFNLFGPIGMAAFLVLLSYLIVRFNIFNTRILSIHIIMITIITIVLSLLFVRDLFILNIIIFISLIIIIIYSTLLIRLFSQALSLEKKSRRELEKLNETKDQFVTIAQHNLRIPITNINNKLNAILSGKYGETNPELNKAIVETMPSVDNLTRIANDFRDITKLKTGSQILNIQTINLKTLIENIIQILKVDIEHMHITITFPTDKTSWPNIKVDSNKIHEVLMVIIENAIKYNRQNGKIEIHTKAENGRFEIKIKNTGVGITVDEKENIFSHSFYRSKRAQKINPIGMGIGLSVSRNIVEAHHGTLLIDSDGENMGAEVILTLPLDFLTEMRVG